jgi:hypothetical protein
MPSDLHWLPPLSAAREGRFIAAVGKVLLPSLQLLPTALPVLPALGLGVRRSALEFPQRLRSQQVLTYGPLLLIRQLDRLSEVACNACWYQYVTCAGCQPPAQLRQ